MVCGGTDAVAVVAEHVEGASFLGICCEFGVLFALEELRVVTKGREEMKRIIIC